MLEVDFTIRFRCWLNLATREACFRINNDVTRIALPFDRFEELVASGQWFMIWDSSNGFDGLDAGPDGGDPRGAEG